MKSLKFLILSTELSGPDTLSGICQFFHKGMQIWMSVSCLLADPITVEHHLKQGDIPPPTLLAVHIVMFSIAFDRNSTPAGIFV